MKKKSFLLSFLILFALLALVGCKKHPSGETLSKVTLNEVAHSIFMPLNMLPYRKAILPKKE